jgi:hypothetical protein
MNPLGGRRAHGGTPWASQTSTPPCSVPQEDVMPLFRKKDHTAEDEAGRVQFERLMVLSSAFRAAELMPAFGPECSEAVDNWVCGGYDEILGYDDGHGGVHSESS